MKLVTPFGQSKRLRRTQFIASFTWCCLVFAFIVVALVGVSFGSTAIPLSVIARILLNGSGLFHFARQWDPAIEVIIWQLRLPIVIEAALVGSALAVAGVLFQGMLRNPLADPFLMGTSSGAALGATMAFVLPLDTVYGTFFPLTPLFAFIGALLTVVLVYAMARTDGHTSVVMLLLAGVVVNAILTAAQNLILTIRPSEDFNRLLGLYSWLAGGIILVSWSPLIVVSAIILISFLCAWSLARVLDAFALGEDGAAHLGLHVEWYKFAIVVLASLLTAAAVSLSGLIGFVGLITPHLMRLLLGPKHRVLLPASALAGAIFLMLADLLARVVFAPTVLPVGIFTALVGAPFFLFLLKNSKQEYKW